MRTLCLRNQANHPQIEAVYYPFHHSHPQYELAQRQMRGGSGLLSFTLKARKIEEIARFTDALQHIRRAVSWGGYESLIVPAAVVSSQDPERINFVRLHVGLESPELIIDDLAQALEQIR